MARVAVILHERLGNWARQLRPRLHELPIRWFETRTIADLDPVLTGMACPVVLIDLGSRPAAGLLGLHAILRRASDARVLVLDPEVHEETPALARELGATHVIPGFLPPPVVAALFHRWVKLAERRIEQSGWSELLDPDSESEPWSWLEHYLAEPASANVTRNDSISSRRPPPGQERSPADARDL